VPVGRVPPPPPELPPLQDVSVIPRTSTKTIVSTGAHRGRWFFRFVQIQARISIAIRSAISAIGRPGNSLGERWPTGNGSSDLAVVVTVTVAVAAVAPPTDTIAGETLHVAIAPLQVNATFPLNPPAAPSESI